MRSTVKNTFLNHEKIIMFLLITGAFVIYAWQKGLLCSGYHLTDDHEIVRISRNIKDNGYFHTLILWMRVDLHIRFRPVYWIVRTAQVFFWGTDWFLWHLAKSVEAGICYFLMYVFARKMKQNVYCSILFSGLHLLGKQYETVWRLGPQENLGMLFLALALIAAVDYHEKRSGKQLVFLMAVTALMMGTKESFLILGPVLAGFLLYLEWSSLNEFSIKGCFRCVVHNRAYVIYTSMLSLVCILVILFFVGTDSIGYAGIDHSFSKNDYIQAVWNIWSGNLRPYLHYLKYAFVLAVLVCAYYLEQENAAKKVFLRLCEMALAGGILAAESMLYAKSGMSARYLLPAVTGIFLYVVIFTSGFFACRKGTKFLYHIGITIMFFSLSVQSGIGSAAAGYASEGTGTTSMLHRINDIAQELDGEDTDILISMFHGEWNLSAASYLQESFNLHRVFTIQQDSRDVLAYDAYQVSGEESANGLEIKDAQIYVEVDGALQEVFQSAGIRTDSLKKETIGYFTIYYW